MTHRFLSTISCITFTDCVTVFWAFIMTVHFCKVQIVLLQVLYGISDFSGVSSLA